MTPEQQRALAAARERIAASAAQNAPETETLYTTKDGGRIFRGSDGQLGFVSDGFATRDPATIKRLMEGATPAQATDWTPEVDHGGPLVAGARGALQGLSFGLGDEIVARGASTLSGRPYEQELAAERNRLSEGRSDHPVASYGSEIAGAVTAPGAAVKALKSPSAVKRSMASGAVAAGSGALYGFNAGEGGVEERAKNAAVTGGISGVFGAAAPGVGALGRLLYNRVAKHGAARATAKSAPTIDELRSRAQDLFNKAEKAPAMDRGTLTGAVSGMAQKAERSGLDEILTPHSDRALNRITEAATDPNPTMTFRDLDILRKQASVPAKSATSSTEAAIGAKMVDDLDDVLAAASPEVSKDVAEARALWGQMRRTEMLDEAAYRAQNQASGYDNGLMSQYRSILNNPKKRTAFSEGEIELMERVARGTRVSNTLRKAGSFGVGIGQQRNGLLATLGLAGGFTMAGPFGLAIPALGTAAQKLAERSTRKAAETARGVTAAGGVKNAPKLSAMQRLLIEDLTRRGANTVEAVR